MLLEWICSWKVKVSVCRHLSNQLSSSLLWILITLQLVNKPRTSATFCMVFAYSSSLTHCKSWVEFASVVAPLFLSEIPGFLSEEECRVVVQLAQLKGLMESQTTTSSHGQESNQPLLSLSTGEIFSLLDLDQDGLLQKQEVTAEKCVLTVRL